MEKMHKSRKRKAYTGGYKIIKKKVLTDNYPKQIKTGTEGQDNCPSVDFRLESKITPLFPI